MCQKYCLGGTIPFSQALFWSLRDCLFFNLMDQQVQLNETNERLYDALSRQTSNSSWLSLYPYSPDLLATDPPPIRTLQLPELLVGPRQTFPNAENPHQVNLFLEYMYLSAIHLNSDLSLIVQPLKLLPDSPPTISKPSRSFVSGLAKNKPWQWCFAFLRLVSHMTALKLELDCVQIHQTL